MPTTAKPRRRDTDEISPLTPATIMASRTCSAIALRTEVVWSLLSSPDSIAPAKSTTVGMAVKRTIESVRDIHRTSAKTGAASGRAR